ncbi:hypothetical protein Bca101_010274 [Brassica carinata]
MTRVTWIVLVPRLVGLTERVMRAALVARATSANPTGGDISQESDRSYPIDQTVDPDPPGSKPKKKSQKKKKSKEVPSDGDAALGGKVASFEGSTDDSSLKNKKTKKTKRPHEDLGGPEGLVNDSSKEVSEENPKKKKKSKKEGPVKKAQQSPSLEEAPVAQGSTRIGEEAVARDSQEKASSEGVLARTESPSGPRILPVKDQETVPPRIPAEATLHEEDLGPRSGEDIVGEGRFSVHEDLPSYADLEKVIEFDDSSHDDDEEGKDGDAEEPQSPIPAKTGEPLREQKGLSLAEESSLLASVEQEGPRGRNEDEMVLSDAPKSQTAPEDGEAAKDPDVDLHTAFTGDSPAAKEPSA